MDFKKATDLETVFEYARAEVHDGDIVLIRIKDPVPASQLRAFRRSFYDQGQEHNWKERNIMALVVNGDVTVKVLSGPVRVEPAVFDRDRACVRAMNYLMERGLKGENLEGLVRAVMSAMADELLEESED